MHAKSVHKTPTHKALNPKANKKYKAILFDKDGVLIDSMETCLRAANDTLERYGLRPWTTEEFRKNWWGIRADLTIGKLLKDVPDSKKKEIFEHYQKKRKEFQHLTKLYPSVTPVLKALKGKYRLGVITSTFRPVALRLLKDFGISEYFDVVVGGEEAKPKPAPNPILKACDKLGVMPAEAVFIGDTTMDIEAGKAAGCTTIIITTSKTRKELKDVKNITIIDDLKELTEILKIA